MSDHRRLPISCASAESPCDYDALTPALVGAWAKGGQAAADPIADARADAWQELGGHPAHRPAQRAPKRRRRPARPPAPPDPVAQYLELAAEHGALLAALVPSSEWASTLEALRARPELCRPIRVAERHADRMAAAVIKGEIEPIHVTHALAALFERWREAVAQVADAQPAGVSP